MTKTPGRTRLGDRKRIDKTLKKALYGLIVIPIRSRQLGHQCFLWEQIDTSSCLMIRYLTGQVPVQAPRDGKPFMLEFARWNQDLKKCETSSRFIRKYLY